MQRLKSPFQKIRCEGVKLKIYSLQEIDSAIIDNYHDQIACYALPDLGLR